MTHSYESLGGMSLTRIEQLLNASENVFVKQKKNAI